MRRLGEISGAIPMARELREGARMVGVFVGDQDAVHAFGLFRPSASKRRSVSLRPMPASMRRVVEAGFEQCRVARAAEAKMEIRNEMRPSSV